MSASTLHTRTTFAEEMDREHQADWGARHKQSINTDVILPVENMAEHLISPRSKFPDTLVPTEHNIQCENAATNYSRPNPPKPHLLHPSMWLYEVASLLSAIYILGGTIIVLAIYDNKPSPIIGGLTLNTIVAFAATLFRMCIMVPVTTCICQLSWPWLKDGFKSLDAVVKIDTASRGPLGSIYLLLTSIFRRVFSISYKLVEVSVKFDQSAIIYVIELDSRKLILCSVPITIAAVVTTLGIVTGPFFQQSVVFFSANVPLAKNSSDAAYASTAITYNGYPGRLASWGETGYDSIDNQ
jgi:hypothetical protein